MPQRYRNSFQFLPSLHLYRKLHTNKDSQFKFKSISNINSTPFSQRVSSSNQSSKERKKKRQNNEELELTVSHDSVARSFSHVKIVRPPCQVGHVERHVELHSEINQDYFFEIKEKRQIQALPHLSII